MEIILASSSPRRQELLKQAGIYFSVVIKSIDEKIPPGLTIIQVAEYLSKCKADVFANVTDKQIIITADTLVGIDDKILGKPENKKDAFSMLGLLSGKKHQVVTGVCLKTINKIKIFHEITEVFIKPISEKDILYYIDNFKPYDKAGGYGIQDWFGLRFIEKVNGCFYNVMGLPVSRVMEEMKIMAQ